MDDRHKLFIAKEDGILGRDDRNETVFETNHNLPIAVSFRVAVHKPVIRRIHGVLKDKKKSNL